MKFMDFVPFLNVIDYLFGITVCFIQGVERTDVADELGMNENDDDHFSKSPLIENEKE